MQRDGTIVGGWGSWLEVPDWAANNQGAGIAVADFGAAGLALIIFQIEHVEPGPNVGLFRIGRKLDSGGNVTEGWSNWQQVPDWISWEDQGAAVAVFDIDADGPPDLFVFHIDDFHTNNPNHPNKAFYRFCTDLKVDGSTSTQLLQPLIDWFSWKEIQTKNRRQTGCRRIHSKKSGLRYSVHPICPGTRAGQLSKRSAGVSP